MTTTIPSTTQFVRGHYGRVEPLQPWGSEMIRAVRAEQLARRIEAVLAATPKFGCLMAMLPGLESELPNWAVDNIPNDTLAADGIEQETHCTVLYGFHLDFDASKLQQEYGGIKLKLGKVSRFECPEYDVIKLTVDSPDLVALNERLMKEHAADITPSKWPYNPHVTIAYVKKGTNKDLDGDKTFAGREITVRQLLYSLPEKQGRIVIEASEQKGHEFHGNQYKKVASRFKPYERYDFPKPLTGPSGHALVAYEWKYKLEEQPDKEGEMVTRRVSDWDAATESSDTGRGLVHHFHVKSPSGDTSVVSVESATKMLGFAGEVSPKARLAISAVKTLAKLRLKLAIAEEQKEAYADAKAQAEKETLPPIEYKGPRTLEFGSRKGEVIGQVFKIGNHESQINYPVHITSTESLSWEHKQDLAEVWRYLRAVEIYGGKPPSVREYEDLVRRIKRQEKKIAEVVESPSIEAFEADDRDAVLAKHAPTERERYAAHQEAQELARQEYRKAVRKALQSAEVAVQEGRDRKKAKESFSLFLWLGALAALAAVYTRLGASLGVTPTLSEAEEENAANRRLEHTAEAVEETFQALEVERQEVEKEIDLKRAEIGLPEAQKPGVKDAKATPRTKREESELSRRLGELAKELEGKTWERPIEVATQITYGEAALRILHLGGFKTKVWSQLERPTKRHSHAENVKLGEQPLDFVYPNKQAYPGDENGGIGEIINCDCMLVGGSRI